MKKCGKSRKLGTTITLLTYPKVHIFILLRYIHRRITTLFQSGSMTDMAVLEGVKS